MGLVTFGGHSWLTSQDWACPDSPTLPPPPPLGSWPCSATVPQFAPFLVVFTFPCLVNTEWPPLRTQGCHPEVRQCRECVAERKASAQEGTPGEDTQEGKRSLSCSCTTWLPSHHATHHSGPCPRSEPQFPLTLSHSPILPPSSPPQCWPLFQGCREFHPSLLLPRPQALILIHTWCSTPWFPDIL